MFKKNASGLYRKVPLIVGVALIPIGLFLVGGTLIWAAILFWLGDWDLVWPVILIAFGASILLRGFFQELELELLQ